jgi:TctA family transporter
LRFVEAHIDGARTVLRGYVIACAAGVVGAIGLATAPEEVTGSAAVLLVAGIAMPLTRTLATIWVNRQTSADVRATVHSFLAQAEYVGEISCGLAIAVIARLAGLSPALVTSAALFAITIVLIQRPSPRRQRRIGGVTSSAKRPTRSSSPGSW